MTVEQTFASLQSEPTGLTEKEWQDRLAKFGKNQLPEHGADPIWLIVLRQFASPLIYILVGAAVVSIIIGDAEDAVFIGIVLAINAAIGAYQEWQAERSSQALRGLLRTRASVLRDGRLQDLPAEELVPGDIVSVESGNRIPADLRLISTQSLEVDESLLTGESNSVEKHSEWIGPESTNLAERSNMIFAGGMVARGRATGVVVETGGQTELGKLAIEVMGSDGAKPPLIVRMERFTKYVAIGTVLASILIGAIGIIFWKYTLLDTFFMVVALAVSAIPEGLPVAMTVALAVAATRMSRRNVIVRKLTAVEGLGSCTLIATDKTGTLTCNELTVREIWIPSDRTLMVTGQGFAPDGKIENQDISKEQNHELDTLLRASVLCNEAELTQVDSKWTWRGDSVDVALLSLGVKGGQVRQSLIEENPLKEQIPFESEQQYAATFHEHDERSSIIAKGAPERIAKMCKGTDQEKALWEQTSLKMARRGIRVLALAEADRSLPIPNHETPIAKDQLKDLHFLGFLGMLDPLRSTAHSAIQECQAAGVQVIMVTGDHRVTAFAIAKELGLAKDEKQVMTSDQLKGDNLDWKEIFDKTSVFARVTPQQKLQIVEGAIQSGHYVAVTGDGANDAPAMKAANIGVAMGKAGTDVAREAAELVLSDDNFSSIVGGIEEGRVAYDNIRKVITLLLSMGAAELVMVMLTVATGLPIPLLPVQLLWLNLVTDGIQGVAMAFEPGDGKSLRRKPRRPDEPIFDRVMLERLWIAVFIVGVGGFLVYYFALQSGMSTFEARNFLLLTMVLFEIFHVGNCRSETQSAFAISPLRSPMLFFGTLAAFGLHLGSMYLPMAQKVLETKPISLQGWLIAIGVGLLIIPAIELHKLWGWARSRSAK